MSDTTPVHAPDGAIPPLRGAARTVWNDSRHALSTLYDLFLIALAVNAVCDLITFFAVRGLPQDSTRTLVITSLVGVAQALLLTPYIISVHRFIVLDEVAPNYFAHFGGERFMRFFGWSLVLTLCFLLPALLVRGLPINEAARGLVLTVVAIAAIIFGLRLSILFPAIAVDAPGAKPGNAMADTKGHAWRIFLLGLLVMLPFVAVVIFLAIIFAVLLDLADRETVISTVIGSIIETVLLTTFVVLASRLFGWLGNHVKQA